MFKAPGLRIVTAAQETIDLGTVVKTTAMNINPQNVAARDRMVATLKQAVADARSR